MRIIAKSEYSGMPWKNGGGTTTEVFADYVSPGAFNWRVSIADVSSSGPFSNFAGYERHIMLLTGKGMDLDFGGGKRIELERLGPVTFSGDSSVVGLLKDGPVRDFNLMVRRDFGAGRLVVRSLTQPSTFASEDETHLIYVLASRGGATQDGLAAGDSLLIAPGEICTVGAGHDLAVCSIKAH
jgi:uncharacterized protein